MTPFDVDSGKFLPKEFRKKEDIKEEYLKKFSQHGFTDVQLVNVYKYLDNLGWVIDENNYNVYMRRPEDIKE